MKKSVLQFAGIVFAVVVLPLVCASVKMAYNASAVAETAVHNTARTEGRLVGLQRGLEPFSCRALQSNSVRVDVGRGCGTGVLVTRKVYRVNKTYVWTAAHVVDSLRNSDGTFRTAQVYRELRNRQGQMVLSFSTEARVIAFSDADSGHDLAVLEVLKDNYDVSSTTFDLSNDPVLVGTALVHVGCTVGLYNSVSYGVLSQTDLDLLKTGRMFDQTSVMGYPGSSGGGVYLAGSGKCIGLLTRGIGPGLNFIVPVRRMRSWAKHEGIEWALDPSIPVPLTRAPSKLESQKPLQKADDEVKPLPPGGPA